MNEIAPQTKNQSQANPLFASRILQRKCACGNHMFGGRECAKCVEKKSGLQRKLTVGASNDPLEQEADRIANQVLSTPAIGSVLSRIQRFAGQTGEEIGEVPTSVDHILASPGSPLEPVLRRDMEQRFGHDFFSTHSPTKSRIAVGDKYVANVTRTPMGGYLLNSIQPWKE